MPIPQTFAEAFIRVKELVSTFKDNEAFYTGPGYQEVDARKDFIDKSWIALGWDFNREEETKSMKTSAPRSIAKSTN